MGNHTYPQSELLACAQAAVSDKAAFDQLKRWVEGGANLFQPLARQDVDQDPFVEAGDTVAGVIVRELPDMGHPVRVWLERVIRAKEMSDAMPAAQSVPRRARF